VTWARTTALADEQAVGPFIPLNRKTVFSSLTIYKDYFNITNIRFNFRKFDLFFKLLFEP
jgi:hypothetical protein